MAELTKNELWVIQVYFEARGFGAHRILDIRRHLQTLSFHYGEQVIDSLVAKKVLSRSPDGVSVKFTDKVSAFDRDEVLIRAGETYLANHLLREIFSAVRKEVAVIDAYVDPSLFDYLAPLADKRLGIRVITLDKILGTSATAKNAMLAYKSFRTQYARAEMRTHAGIVHDRFILWDRKGGGPSGPFDQGLGQEGCPGEPPNRRKQAVETI